MKVIFAFLCFFILLGAILYSCKKSTSEPVLPPITQTGANVFACKINGKVWLPHYKCNDWTGGIELAYNFQSMDSFSILPVSFVIYAGRDQNKQYSHFNINANYSSFSSTGNIIDSLDLEFSGDDF